ncbi:uncharacterized protein LOC128550190 [Mercenaria mercenaria]|uniref:uncharacterized protein LOC128550190 n=1 Tax=Mercenaria mercenaria TaxID=6596 RepID=UPI00234ECF0D|nr:uncharacterized protein LOC128550190 [Mercenaria mercenaria]
MASGGSYDDDDFYKRVLSSSQKRFVSDADPVALLDVCLQKQIIGQDLCRDISELANTSQKNRQILETVCSKGKDGYRRFKECLRESGQRHLADHLEQNENEIKQTARKKTIQTIGKVSDEDLAQIAHKIGKNWEQLAPALGLMNVEVERIYQMLMTWKKKYGEAATLQNLSSKIQSMPSVNVDMDYIYDNVSNAVMADSYQRSKPTRVMPQDVKGDLRLEPVENSVSISSGSNGGEDKYKQVEEQPSSSNIVNGVSAAKERSEQQPQEESPNASTASRSEKVITAENQIDTNTTPSSELPTPTVEPTYENLNMSFKSEYDSTEKQPIQASQDEKSDGDLSALDTLQYKEKDKGRGENKDCCLSKNIVVERPAESNDDSSSAARENRLQKVFKPPRDKPRRKCTHDGKLLICEEGVFRDIKAYCNTNKPIEGGFGYVYISERKIPGLDIKVALKEMNCAGGNEHFEHSATNEKLASRIMHFAIVPLLAMGCDTNERIYWFLSRCLDKGDLYTLIEKDTSRIEKNAVADIELNRQRRLKILYHISAAIDFLHTEIENFRGAIIHLDVKTRNVVLDRFYNARLTDFGVARETTENETSIKTSPTAIPLTKGYFHPPTYDKLEKYFDYFNIGVVIRELLTGKHANFKYSEDSKEQYLKDLDEVEVEYNVQDNIWNDQKKLCQSAEILLTLSQQCIDSAKQSEVRKDDKLTSEDILKETQRLIDQFCSGAWERLPAEEQNSDDDNCEMCMINPSAETVASVKQSVARKPQDLILKH